MKKTAKATVHLCRVSEPLVLGGELADGQELAMGSALLAAGLAGLFVSI